MNAPPPLRAVIVDDEQPARENLRLLLEQFCPQVQVVGTGDGVVQGAERIRTHRPDVLFLDIRMPSGAEGFDLLDQLGEEAPLVVFVTAFKDYAIEAFHAHAVDYLLKPIDPDELQRAVLAVQDRIGQLDHDPEKREAYREDLRAISRAVGTAGSRITVDHARGFKLFDPGSITHLEADGNCTLIHFSDGTRYLDTRTLRVYEELLKEEHFLRVHRSHLVNLRHVREYLREDGHWVVLAGGARVPIARDRLDAFLTAVRR
ncbi:MAG: response regulator transcription factor [Flavobacteriales bacterium]|nr:response regulator transcription factor [Flavobacteriales bacterium]